MLSERSTVTITELAREFNVERIYLFGSALKKMEKDCGDIDIGIEGLKPEFFYKFHGQLLMQLNKPVDIVEMEDQNSITYLIQDEGAVIYERKSA